jgi:hypothetical protein
LVIDHRCRRGLHQLVDDIDGSSRFEVRTGVL